MKWFVVVNPMAGGGSAGRKWEVVRKEMLRRGISFSQGMTCGPQSTRALVTDAISDGYGGIAVYGGDGTLSDAASIVSGNLKVVIAAIPAGSGNDWARSIGFSQPSVESSLDSLASGRTRTLDTAFAMLNDRKVFFLNSAGIGFDAFVLKRSISIRKRVPLGSFCYLSALFISALSPPVWSGEFACDGKVFYRGSYLTFTAGVGTYSGGGMRLCPSAVPWDGYLDGLCLSPMGFFSILRHFKRIYDGTLAATTWATTTRGRSIGIRSFGQPPLILELDGETVETGGSSEVELVSVPGSLRAAVPPG